MTQTQTHTPGPWTVDIWDYPNATPPRKELIVTTPTRRIANLDWDEGKDNPYTIPQDEARANARLIAAALDYYKFNQFFIDTLAQHFEGLEDDDDFYEGPPAKWLKNRYFEAKELQAEVKGKENKS